MLYISLTISAIILLVLNLTAFTKSRPVIMASICCGILALVIPFFPLGYFPAVSVQSLLLVFLVAPAWQYRKWKPKRFVWLSCFATVLAYAGVGISVVRKQVELSELLEKYPYESLEDRTPVLPQATQPVVYDQSKLDLYEYQVELIANLLYPYRSPSLKKLHDHSVRNFVDSWGFGMARMPLVPNEWNLKTEDRPSLLQPSNPDYTPAPGTHFAYDSVEQHKSAVFDFINPTGFGYVKDRQHVAGFQSHRFGKVPGPIKTWESSRSSTDWHVTRLELVSLLMHKEPSVYLSDRLPQMDALKGVPTRPLDAFETEGLAALRKGEDLFVREDRMLGSIRSVKQCIACHGGDRGQLLGAFTYTLRPVK